MKAVVRIAALVALVCRSATAGDETPLPGDALERDTVVERREQDFSTAGAALAEARARQAGAKGMSELAAVQWRKVLVHRQSRLKAVQVMCAQGRICSPAPLQEAQGSVTIARARLADVEGRREDLLAELPKIIAHYERQVRSYEELRRHAAVSEDDAREALNEFEKELQWVRERVVAVRGNQETPEKTGKTGVPSWPQFRGANSAGVAGDDRPLPVEFGPDKNCLWKTPLPLGHSSPCIWGDRIFLTGYDAAVPKLETICLDRLTGQIVWRQFAPAEKIEKGHELGNPAASTPAVDAERVYAYFGSFGLIAYDHAGVEQWKVPLSLPTTRFGTATSPVLAEGRLILNQQGGSTLAFDPKTGEQLWKTAKLPFSPDYALPVVRKVGDVTELIVQGTVGMSGIDLQDGSLRWQVGGFAFQPIPTPVLGAGLLFVVSFHPIGRSEDRIQFTFDELLEKYDKNGDKKLAEDEVPGKLALVSRGDLEGRGDMTFQQMWFMLDANRDKAIDSAEWSKVEEFTGQINNALLAFRPGPDGKIGQDGIAWKAERGLPESPSPIFYRGRLYTVKNGGVVSCYAAASGKLYYQKRLGAEGSYYASPVAGDGKIFTSSMNGVVTVIAADDELHVLARNDLGESLMATPAIVEGKLYIRSAGHLYAFGARE